MIGSLLAIVCLMNLVPPTRATDQSPTPRGITGSVTIAHTGELLRAKLDQELSSPLILRVTDLTPDLAPTAEHRYRIDFIGTVAGTFDLRPLIYHRDGTPAIGLAPMDATIISELPKKFGTDLFTVSAQPAFAISHYRTVIAAIAIIWIAIPIVVFVRRLIRNRPVALPPPPASAPTLADQLRPLVESAMTDGLSTRDQARLELLVMAFWSERRDFTSLNPAQAISKLRADPEASTLILAIESWLHQRGSVAPRPAHELSTLLDPFRAHGPIYLDEGSR